MKAEIKTGRAIACVSLSPSRYTDYARPAVLLIFTTTLESRPTLTFEL